MTKVRTGFSKSAYSTEVMIFESFCMSPFEIKFITLLLTPALNFHTVSYLTH